MQRLPSTGRHSIIDNDVREEFYPARNWPGERACDHLEFAIKYDGINLALLCSLFRHIEPQELADFILEHPVSIPRRKLWFLYEFLTGTLLPLEDADKGNYILLLDPEEYYTLKNGVRSSRQRVINNLTVTVPFCPLIRRTDRLKQVEQTNFIEQCAHILDAYPPELLRRALSYLYTKETRSSFAIEHIKPTPSRREKFVSLLTLAETDDFCERSRLLELQNLIVDSRFADTEFRTIQNYVGQTITFQKENVHYIAPKSEDVESLIEGLVEAHQKMHAGDIPAIVHAYPKNMNCIGLEDREDPFRESKPDIRPLRNVSSGKNHFRQSAANCFYPIFIKDGKVIGFGDVCSDDFHPQGINEKGDDGVINVYPIDPSGAESKWVFARQKVESIRNELTAEYNQKKKTWDMIREKRRFRYKSLWEDKRYSANSWGSVVLNGMFPSNSFTYPKSIYTVRDCVDAGLNNSKEGTILDYFAGSGTTAHAVIDLNREDQGKRKYILVEQGDYFDTVLKPRIQKVVYSAEWKDGKATAPQTGISHAFKLVKLESYEDTLNNLEPSRTRQHELALDSPDAQGADGFKEHYLLHYMLDVESCGSQSLLNVRAFTDPTAYKLKVKRPGSGESGEVNIDLLETFNWLIGLTVQHIAAPQSFSASFERDNEKRLRLNGRLKQEEGASYWFRTITGTTPDGRKTLIIWCKLTGEPEYDNLVLDEWFRKHAYSTRDTDFDLIFVNGGNNLPNMRRDDETWKVRLIEEDFHRLMFENREGV